MADFPNVKKRNKEAIALFKDLALKKLQSEVAEMQETLLHFNLQLDSLFSVNLSKECRKIEQINCGNWIAPAIEIPFENQKNSIIGTLTDLSIKGLISKESNHLEGLIQIWRRK